MDSSDLKAAAGLLLLSFSVQAAAPPITREPLPAGAVARLGTTRFRHGGWVRSMAHSRDGRRLVTGGQGYLRLWGAATGDLLHHHQPKESSYMLGVALAPDGRTVAFAPFNGFTLVDLVTGRVVRSLDAAGSSAAAYSPDGKLLATLREGGVTLWEVATGTVVARHESAGAGEAPMPAAVLCWSGDGTRLAWTDGRAVRVRDTKTGEVAPGIAAAGRRAVVAVALSADGTRLAAAGEDGAVRLWDVASRTKLRAFEGHAKAPHFLAFSPDGAMLATGSGFMVRGEDGDLEGVRLWDTATGKELAKLGRHPEGVSGVCFSPDGKRLYSGSDMSVRVWDAKTREEVLFGPGHHGWVAALAYSPDGRTLASAGSDLTVRLWDVGTRKERQLLRGCQASIDSVAFRPDGAMLAAGCRDGAVVVWALPGGKEVARLKAGGDAHAAFSPDGARLAAVSRAGGQITLWDATTLQEERRLPRKELGLVSLAFAPDGKRLAVGCSGERSKTDRKKPTDMVRLWDVALGTEVRRFEGTGQLFVWSVQFSPDGQLLAAGNTGGTVDVWDARSGRLRWRTKPLAAGGCVAFSPDGRVLATTGPAGDLCLWETATGGERRRWPGGVGMNGAVAFAPDGAAVATGGMDTAVLLWDVRRPLAGSKAEAAEHWKALAGRDAGKAYDAILALAADPAASVTFLRGQLRPAAADTVTALLADLDSDAFARREEATKALRRLGSVAEPALRKAAQDGPSLEVRRRAGRLLDELERQELSPEELRAVRAVEALERCGPAARGLLEALGRGADGARLTLEAKAAVARLPAR